MMLAAPNVDSLELGTASEAVIHRAPIEYVTRIEPIPQTTTTYSLRKRMLSIEGGRLLLKLTGLPQVELNHHTLECKVIGWNVSVNASEVDSLPRMMSRRFLELFSKSDLGQLTESEKNDWLSILDEVDFQAFCIDRSPPQYLEAKVLQTNPVFRVELHDGSIQKLEPSVARSLSSLAKGDEFGCYAKFGLDNKILSIERIRLLQC